MPNYNTDWSNFVFYNIPVHLRKLYRLKWIDLLVSEVKKLHAKLLTYRTNTIYTVAHTNQKISIEKVLNDKFDAINKQIYIALINPIDVLYLRNKVESQTMYLYNKWDSSVAYSTDEYSSYGIYVWKATAASTNETPFDGSSYWEIHAPRLFLNNKAEYAGKGFIVFVPTTVTYDEAYMKSLIDYYRLAGMHYIIQTYTP